MKRSLLKGLFPLGLWLMPAYAEEPCDISLRFHNQWELKERENELFKITDVAFTGGINLYHAKKNCHTNIHGVPSSIDKDHFFKARLDQPDPGDQESINHPRFGFYGLFRSC